MDPLTKAIGTVLALAAGTLGASMQDTPLGLPAGLPGPWSRGGDSANETGNATQGNGTSGSPAPGNGTAGNQTTSGNQTAPGNQTAAGNRTADGNETEASEPEPTDPEVRAAVCSFDLRESGSDLSPGRHEWEWLVTHDVQHLQVSFWGGGGVPTGLADHAEVRLADGSGRTLAHASGDGFLDVFLERGVDAMADGVWRLTYETSDALADYNVQVSLHCAGG